ncbi:MAG: SDR family oxidoreductase [Hyphomicrobiaceae bacterium]|nr:MAG: SDR family oxidoreductase [Hyphomicrobiaceae bacterium]
MSGPSVIITGGASGIGAATARRVVRAGGKVGLIDLDVERADVLVRELAPHVVVVRADVTKEAEVRAAHDELAAQLPPIDGLVNSAAVTPTSAPIEDLAPEAFDRVLNSHVTGTYVPCRVIGSAMARRGAGAIVNLASVLSFRSGPVLAYGAGKAGVVSLTEALAVHWARKGVRVNAVAPGWTETPFITRRRADFDTICAATPMGRLLQPAEVAEVIWFLLSPAASGMTGATVPCDGGYIAGGAWAAYGGFPGP